MPLCAAPQYELLPFPPLVIASSALLCAWSHLGELKAVERHMPQLCALCGVSMVCPPPIPMTCPHRPHAPSALPRQSPTCYPYATRPGPTAAATHPPPHDLC